MSKRVVITGLGIWSCIGNNIQSVKENLEHGYTGIIYDCRRKNKLNSCLCGNVPTPESSNLVDRHWRIMMSEDSAYAYMAVSQALQHSNLTDEYRNKNGVGLVWGNDGNSHLAHAHRIMAKERNSYMLGVYQPIYTSMSKILLNSIFNLRGSSFNISAACASGAHAIGLGYFFIKNNIENVIVAGASMETNSFFAESFDVLGATSLRNSDPTHASRPFDRDRDGMVPSGGAAALVLEEYEHAKARGANIIAEVCGYGFSSNGIEDISAPSADAEYIAMKRALDDAGIKPEEVDYVNAHGTSTIAGDIEEAKALTRLFVPSSPSSLSSLSSPSSSSSLSSLSSLSRPFISSTKSMTGHENWMAGASEAVYSIIMMQNNFVAPNINLENVIDEAKYLNIARKTIYTPINTVLSNSSGMGGTNSALVFRKI
ncbi:MAG: beta-ketoacyl-[Paludibacteraceae bacterium]|nr:beta-ketoacyl-[acyl-carrier-protein] synthase family protein [Paludibacteraceae bacterium]